MSQTQVQQAISDILSEIRTELLDSGLKPTAIAFKMERLSGASEKDQESARAWLIGFRDVYIQEYIKVKRLVPEHVWQHYKNHNMRKGLYEIDQRNNVTARLHKAWQDRPACLRRTKQRNDLVGK